MKELIEEITRLTETWYKLIGPSHHKDKINIFHIPLQTLLVGWSLV